MPSRPDRAIRGGYFAPRDSFVTGRPKKALRHFWQYRDKEPAGKHWGHWYFWATHSRLKPMIEAARTLKRHEAGLLSFFAHASPTPPPRGLNSRIQAIKVSARGYRNREHFKTAIYFHCGGLALYPQAARHPHATR